MCLAVGRVQFGRVDAVQEEASRREAALADPVGRAAAEEPQDDRLFDFAQRREAAGAERAAREENAPKIAERRLRAAARHPDQQQHRPLEQALARRPDVRKSLRERLHVLR